MLKLAGKGAPVYEKDTELFMRAYSDDRRFVLNCRKHLQRSVARRKNLWKVLGG
jgi:hypothetical protein